MTIEFINAEEWGIEIEAFTPYIKRLEKAVKTLDGILNVVFVNDVYIQALNKKYRNKDIPTDVLSFNYGEGDLIGEIYISVETAKEQAKEMRHSLSDELNKLFVHGFLHIHGHDHESDKDYKMMLAIESKVLDL